MLHTVSGRGRTARPYPVWASGVSVRACVSGCPDAYNRQLHPDEKQKLQKKANEIAAALAKNPQDQAAMAQYWNSMLTIAASADVDMQSAQQLNAYVNQLTQAAKVSGNYGPLNQFMSDLGTAQQAVQSMAGQTLVGTTGNAIVADGSVVRSFQSTPAQAKDIGLFGNGPLGAVDTRNALGPGNTLATVGWRSTGNSTTQQQIQALEQNTLQQASTPNGAVTPVYPVESVVLGGVAGKVASGALGAIIESGAASVVPATASIADRVLGNIADSQAARASSNFDVFLARSDQVQWGYAADQWTMQSLPNGSIVYGGLPGQSAYYTTEQALIDAGYSRTSLFQSLQVKPHPEFGYRPQMGIYQVNGDISVPAGTVRANPALGPGDAPQYFIKNFQNQLKLIGKVNLGK